MNFREELHKAVEKALANTDGVLSHDTTEQVKGAVTAIFSHNFPEHDFKVHVEADPKDPNILHVTYTPFIPPGHIAIDFVLSGDPMDASKFLDKCDAIIAKGKKPTVPTVRPLVQYFYAQPGNSCGGHLHIVLDDFNFERHHLEFCAQEADKADDIMCLRLCRVLMLMSKTQLRKL